MALSSTAVLWRDLTMATGPSATYRITSLEGWEGLPAPRYDKLNRTRGHGSHSSPVWADERVVTVEGRSWDQENRDQVLWELQSRMTFDGGEEPLTVTAAGRTLTAAAQLLRCDPVMVAQDWGIGRFGWIAQWRCPDPLRYGLPGAPLSTGLPTSSGGLTYPLVYPLTYGVAGNSGRITIPNPGSAPASIVFDVSGPLPAGFELSSGSQRLVYPVAVPAGQVITIDTAAGSVVAEGTADRRGNLTVADWLQVPPGSALAVQFSSLGGAYDAAATVTVAAPRGAYW